MPQGLRYGERLRTLGERVEERMSGVGDERG